MKKIFKTLTLSIAVAFMGIFCLVGCGSGEFANAEKISSTAMSEYLQTSTSKFSGYQMTMNMIGVDIFNATVVIDETTNDIQLAMTLNMPASITGETEDLEGTIYLKNNVAYVESAGQKVKQTFDSTSQDFSQLQEALSFSGDLKNLIMETFTEVESDKLSIKMVTEETTTKFLIEVKEVTGYGYVKYSMKLVYEDNALVELVETTKVGKDIMTKTSIKAYTGEVNFPADLETDPSYIDGDSVQDGNQDQVA